MSEFFERISEENNLIIPEENNYGKKIKKYGKQSKNNLEIIILE